MMCYVEQLNMKSGIDLTGDNCDWRSASLSTLFMNLVSETLTGQVSRKTVCTETLLVILGAAASLRKPRGFYRVCFFPKNFPFENVYSIFKYCLL